MKSKTLSQRDYNLIVQALAEYSFALGDNGAVPYGNSIHGDLKLLSRMRDLVDASYKHCLMLDKLDVTMLRHIHSQMVLSKTENAEFKDVIERLDQTASETAFILSRDAKKRGVILNPRSYGCPMEGCTGVRMYVKWEDGRYTFPCSKGVVQLSNNYRFTTSYFQIQ